jgi:hypothetical protein
MDPRCHVIISLSIHRTRHAILQEGEDSMDPRCHVIISLAFFIYILWNWKCYTAGRRGLHGSSVSRDHQPGPGAPQEPQGQEGVFVFCRLYPPPPPQPPRLCLWLLPVISLLFITLYRTLQPFMYSFSGNSAAAVPIPTFIIHSCVCERFIFPGSVHIFSYSRILEYINI